jgi:Skp family chaperone for outer membrane proteins
VLSSALSINRPDVKGYVMGSKFGMGMLAFVALGITFPEPETDPDQRSQMTVTKTAIVDLEACRDAWRKEHPVPDAALKTIELLRRLDREQEAESETDADAELPEMTDEARAELLVLERDLQRRRAMYERAFINSFRDTLKQVCEERKIDVVLQKISDPKVPEMFCGIRLPDLSTHSILYASDKLDITERVIERIKARSLED